MELALQPLFSAAGLWLNFPNSSTLSVWHLERNCLVHRVSIGRFGYSHHYQDADLKIVLRFSTKFNVPYYRLHVVVNEKSHFLLIEMRRN
jgi:hypothetical protein